MLQENVLSNDGNSAFSKAFLDKCHILEMGPDGGLVAGRSQREKRRSYKDLLREEEEIAAEVRKSSKKRPKVWDLSSHTVS